MNNLSVLPKVALAFVLGACISSGDASPPATQPTHEATVSPSLDGAHETVLLVSLEDGSVIKQTISSSADICFKSNSDSSTTCLTQGAPLIDPITNTVIGYEMIEDHIELVAKSD